MPLGDHISLVFHLNGKPFSRWYYDWESGANKAQRLMKHVLKAYIVEHCAVDANDNFVSFTSQQACKQLYRVLHVVTSPEFTVISYRRAPSDPYQTALLPSRSMSGDDTLAYEGTRLSYASVTVKVEPSLTRAEQVTQERPLELPDGVSPSTEKEERKEGDRIIPWLRIEGHSTSSPAESARIDVLYRSRGHAVIPMTLERDVAAKVMEQYQPTNDNGVLTDEMESSVWTRMAIV
uniref:Uncharacterized protein n=1 Tax=Hyaloperonospora arabidopsidis (strain Emoy2) TaxID=559515 RepID=M4B8C3_HYAAE